MTDQIILGSVGSYIETDGRVGALSSNGLPDLTDDGHVTDCVHEWFYEMSDEDFDAVRYVLEDNFLVQKNKTRDEIISEVASIR